MMIRLPLLVALTACGGIGTATRATPDRGGPSTVVDMAGYDRTCVTDEDCALVRPTPCAPCGCTDAPIAAREVERFRSAVAAISCPPPTPEELEDTCGGCPGFAPVCRAGTCDVEQR